MVGHPIVVGLPNVGGPLVVPLLLVGRLGPHRLARPCYGLLPLEALGPTWYISWLT